MRTSSDSSFQIRFTYPEDNSIREYLRLKEFDHEAASWSYYEDTINFGKLSSSSPSEDADTSLQNKVYFLSSSDFSRKNTNFPSIIEENLDERTPCKDKGSIIYLAEVSQVKIKEHKQKITNFKKYKSSDVVSAGLEKNSSHFLGAALDYPKKK